MKYVKAAKTGDMLPGESKSVTLEKGEHVLICNVGGTFYAVVDACTHDGGMLGFGTLEGKVVTCPRHGAKFDVTTGRVVELPARAPLRTYPLRVQGDDIEISLE